MILYDVVSKKMAAKVSPAPMYVVCGTHTAAVKWINENGNHKHMFPCGTINSPDDLCVVRRESLL